MIREFVHNNVAYFADGDLDRVAPYFHTPMAVHEGDRIEVLSQTTDILEGFVQRRAHYTRLGVSEIMGTISAVELKRNQQFRFWVSWDYRVDCGQAPDSSQAIYYCQDAVAGFQIQMIQTTRSYQMASVSSAPTILRARPLYH